MDNRFNCCIYKYKGKDYTKEEFYSLVRTTMVQPRTVQKYNKILFPTGNTASKIEGHDTLEEFKKRKEDRIKELEQNPSLIENGEYIIENSYFKYDGEIFDQGSKLIVRDGFYNIVDFSKSKILNREQALNFLKKANITPTFVSDKKEINQLKQELERVEKEGFGALRPIYNFYENTITNILKKQGYNPVLITDEYGNTWNEVEINNKSKETILLQKENTSKVNTLTQEEASNLQNKLNKLYPEIKVNFQNLPNESFRGQANLEALSILINKAKENSDTLPHEYAHFYVAWFRDSDKVKQGIRLFGSEEKLVQAIGEQVALRKGKAYTWFQQFWNWIKSLFNKNDILQDLTQGFLTNKDLGNKNTSIFGKRNQDAVDEKLEKAVNENLNKLFQRIEQLKTRAGGTHHQQIKSNIKALYARAQDLAENRTYEKLAEIALFQLAEAKRIVNSSNPSSFEIDEARRVIEYTKDFDKYLEGLPEFEDKKRSIRAHNVSIGIRVRELITKDILKAAKRAQVDLTEEDINKAYKDEAFLASETLAPETSHIPMVALGGNLLNMNKKISSEIFNKKFTVQLNDLLKQTGKKKFETSDFSEITEGGMLILSFSSKYFKEQSDMWKEHYDLIKEYKADPASKELKAKVANSFDNIFNWYKESSYYYLTLEAEKKYKADLEDVRKANLDSDGNLTSRGKIEVDKWIAENSPYLVGKKDSSGKITIHVNSVPGTRIGDSTIYNQNWHKYLKAEPREKYLNSKWEKASKNPLHQFMLVNYCEAN